MMFMFSMQYLLIAAAVAGCAALAPVRHEEPDMLSDWRKLETPVTPDHSITLRLSVKQQNLEELYKTALAVSDPKSPSYGQYLTAAAVKSLTAPAKTDITTVTNWLTQHSVNFSVDGSIIEAKLTAAVAAKLLNTQFHHLSNDATGQHTVRAEDYWLPSEVDNAIAAVYGMHGLPLPPRVALSPLVGQDAVPDVNPKVLEGTYNVSGVKISGSTKNRQAVAEFQGQTMKPEDLSKFFSMYVPSAPTSEGKIYNFVGDKGTGIAGVEASLDVDYIMGVAPGLLTEFWYYQSMDFCGDMQKWTSQIINATNPPLVHSVSYGWQGELKSLGCKDAAVQDVDANLAKLATMGITIIFASGDSGSGYSDYSSTNKNKLYNKLYPSWPASSQWVTAVGATRFVNQQVGEPEMASDMFGSGGGFSTMFDAFKDQVAAVKHYLEIAEDLPPAGYFPPGGRATPDVSALGEGFQVLANGRTTVVGGTSASAPTFGGLVSLLNEARIQAGKPAMGYLNPFLYQNADAFRDVILGTNAIGRGTGPLKYGFKCAKGWDPATGLGTPNFKALQVAAMKAVAGGDAVLVV